MEQNAQLPVQNLTKPLVKLIDSFYYLEQLVKAERQPDPFCKKCDGTGYKGTLRQKPSPKDHIRPNDSCFCKSGIKYKKCHQKKIERLAKSGATILACACVGKCELASNPDLDILRTEMASLLTGKPPEKTLQVPVL